MAGKKANGTRLSIVAPGENIPALLRCYPRVPGAEAHSGEYAYAYRPGDGSGLLIHVRKGAARIWRPDANDAPAMPTTEVVAAEAIREFKAIQQIKVERHEVWLRGQWEGALAIGPGGPVVELRRKVASYGAITLTSDPATRTWTARVARDKRWFTEAEVTIRDGLPGLIAAAQVAFAEAMQLVSAACVVRDVGRRAAFDKVHAAAHPPKLPKDGREVGAPMEAPAARKPRPRGAEPSPRSATPSAGQKPSAVTGEAACGCASHTGAGPCAAAPRAPRKAKPASPKAAPAHPPPRAVAGPEAPTPGSRDAALLASFQDALRTALAEAS